jgi:hypothetical protein
MKIRMLLLMIFALSLSAHAASAQHSVTLNWIASADSTTTTPGTVSVFRATGTCPASGIGTLTYTTLTSTAPAGGPYTDTAVTVGSAYCYYITATIGSATSGPSNTVGAVIPVGPPTSLIIVVK